MYNCDLDIHGVRIRVTSRQQEDVALLKASYGLFLTVHAFHPDTEIVWPENGDLDLLPCLAKHNLFGFHAAGYKTGKDKGVLLPAGSASGKTTVAYSALLPGYKLVGDDVVLCHRSTKGVEMLPLKNYFSLKKGGETNIYYVLDHHPSDVFCTAYVAAVVFPQIVDDLNSTISIISDKSVVLSRLLSTAVWMQDNTVARNLASLVEQICKLPAYDLLLGKDHLVRPQLALELIDNI